MAHRLGRQETSAGWVRREGGEILVEGRVRDMDGVQRLLTASHLRNLIDPWSRGASAGECGRRDFCSRRMVKGLLQRK